MTQKRKSLLTGCKSLFVWGVFNKLFLIGLLVLSSWLLYKQLWITRPAINSFLSSKERISKFIHRNSEGQDIDETRNIATNYNTKGESDNESTSDMKTSVIESLDAKPVMIERCNCSISPLNALCLRRSPFPSTTFQDKGLFLFIQL